MFLYSKWRSIPLNTRHKIAAQFKIVKVGPTHVRDNYVESDGYKIEDVEHVLNVDAIQQFLGVDSTDLNILVDLLVSKVEGKEEPKDEETEVSIPGAEIVKETVEGKPKRKYTKKK